MAIRFGPLLYLALIVLAGVFWTQLDGLLYPAGVFPRVVLVVLATCSVVALVREVATAEPQPVVNPRVLFAFGVAASTVVYILAMTVIGFYPASTLYLLLLYPLVNMVKDGAALSWRLVAGSVLATAVVIGALYVVFTMLLRINVPMLLENGPF